MIEGYQPVAKVSDIKPGERKIINVAGKAIGIFNVEGTFHAFLNRCPHMGAPLCKGRLTKEIQAEKQGAYTISSNNVLRCPWHGWEFDINSGNAIIDETIRAKKFKLKILNNMIYCKV